MASPTHAPMFSRELGLPGRLAIYGLISLALMLADSRYDALATLRAGVATVLQPVQRGLVWPFGFLGEAGRFFVTHGEVLRENRRLEADRQQLMTRLQGYRNLEAENERLRTLLGLAPPAGTLPMAAEVLRALPDPFARKLLIDRGASHGIEAGRPVVDVDGLLGQVTRVYPASSEVTLLTSREQAAPVQNLRNGLRLIVSGTGADDRLEVRFLDMHADLKAGDVLVTSGLDGVYPAGIPVARVIQVEPPRQTPFARAVCVAAAAIGHYRHLLVLRRTEAAGP